MSLLPVAEAQARLLALGRPLPIETAPLAEAAGRHLAAPILALRDQPAADLSAMDGYALRFADLREPLTVIGESAAGRGLDRALGTGEAARIFTGAPLPAGADTILIQEEAAREGAVLRLAGAGPARTGASVRRRASDFARGAPLLGVGERLTPARIALAAIAGHGALPVHRRPRIAILSTGDELVAPGAPTMGAMLPASNGAMLAAMLRPLGVAIEEGGIVPDRLEALSDAFAAAARADIIVTTGGVSVGDHDLVRPALEQAGARLDFWRVAMRPGKPLMAGKLGGAIMLGLAGNPVAAFVTAHLFLLPLVRHLAGDPGPLPPMLPMPLGADLPPVGGRTDFVRARIAEGVAMPFPSTDSALLLELSRAGLLIQRPAGAPAARAGEIVDVLPL